MDYKDRSEERLNNHVDKLLEIVEAIPLNQITILTGGNAMGKSVIRKQVGFHIQELLKKTSPKDLVASISMQARTENKPEWGALSNMMHDLPWNSTSDFTIHSLRQLLKCTKKFLVIDEIEIGMSKEVQAGLCLYLNETLPEILKENLGLLVITHSDVVVKNLKHDKFLNIEGMTEEEWVNREITPISPDDLEAWADALFKTIRDRSKEK